MNESALRAGIVSGVYCYLAPKIFGGADAKTPVEGWASRWQRTPGSADRPASVSSEKIFCLRTRCSGKTKKSNDEIRRKRRTPCLQGL